MDKNLLQSYENKVKQTLENLEKNNMNAYYCKTSEEACELVKSLIQKGNKIASGGSITLAQTNIISILKNKDYTYFDRNNVNPDNLDEIENIYHQAFNCDVYFSSANAITTSGCLYNVDGNSNRVAAILYGPKSVIIVAGINKLVDSIDDAIKRVKFKTAPANCNRLNIESYCSKTGKCISLEKQTSKICDGCDGDGRICCNYVISAKQRKKGRIKVIIVGESLGY